MPPAGSELPLTWKVWALLTPEERRRAVGLLGLAFVGTALETLGLGLVVPALALLTQPDFLSEYPGLEPLLRMVGDPSPDILVVWGMLALVSVFLVKGLFLVFLQ